MFPNQTRTMLVFSLVISTCYLKRKPLSMLRSTLPLVLLFVTHFIALNNQPLRAQEQEWRSMFDGVELDEWKNPYDWGTAEVVEEEIHLKADRKFFLVFDESFQTSNSKAKFTCQKAPQFWFHVSLSCRT